MKSLPPLLATIVLVLLLLGGYVGAYLCLGECRLCARDEWGVPWTSGDYDVVRVFNSEWETGVFETAASVEGYFRGCNVELGYSDPTFNPDAMQQ